MFGNINLAYLLSNGLNRIEMVYCMVSFVGYFYTVLKWS